MSPMNNVAKLLVPSSPDAGPPRLGAARVTAVELPWVQVELPARSVRARIALAVPYEPAVGDDVLVIGDDAEHWVIGVIATSGRGALAFPGDLEVRAGGTLRLTGTQVEVRGEEVRVFAAKLKTFAESALETFGSVKQRVRDLLAVHAGEARTIVDGGAHTQADHATLLTKGKVGINGKAVHLG